MKLQPPVTSTRVASCELMVDLLLLRVDLGLRGGEAEAHEREESQWETLEISRTAAGILENADKRDLWIRLPVFG